MTSSQVITLTTDFGIEDTYVGVMKGVIVSNNPAAQVIDLTHSIAPQNILQAAYTIYDNYCYFPAGTVHVIVVDPGVGSTRRIILAETHGHIFLAPDNGVLSCFIKNNQISRAFVLDRKDLYRAPVSHTFHGRDIFSPVAAHLAQGNSPKTFGPECESKDLALIDLPQPKINIDRSSIEGVIVGIDHFGNLITNINSSHLEDLNASPEKLALIFKTLTIKGLQDNYISTPPGEILFLTNSQNHIEIAMSQGNAQTALKASLSESVFISCLP